MQLVFKKRGLEDRKKYSTFTESYESIDPICSRKLSIQIITLNVNELNRQLKGRYYKIGKHMLPHFKYKDTDSLKLTRWKKHNVQAQIKRKLEWLSDRVCCRARNIS